MKKVITATSVVAAFALAPAAMASTPTRAHVRRYLRAYTAVRQKFGVRAPGCNLVTRRGSCHMKASDADVIGSLATLQRMLNPTPVVTASAVPAGVGSAGGAISNPRSLAASGVAETGALDSVPGVPQSFAACVALRESTDGKGSSNIYGILGPGGQGSLAEQKQAFSQMYAARGTEPWAPYDGC